MTAKIYVGTITHKHGEDFYFAATEADLTAKAAAFADNWAEDEMGKPLPEGLSDDEKVKTYFDFMEEKERGEYYNADTAEIPGYVLVKLPTGDETPSTVDDLIAEALAFEADSFQDDEEVNGGDLVEFFADWRQRMAAALQAKRAGA